MTTAPPSPGALRRVLVLYNTDYDEELKAQSGTDVSAVQEAARAVTDAVSDYGFEAELAGVHGDDLAELVERLRLEPPDLAFNLCESLRGDTRNEQVVPAVLDLFKVPYTGPDALTIGLSLHKDRSKEILLSREIPTPEHLVLRGPGDLDRLGDASALRFPYFVKLAREDASIGIEASNVVRDLDQLRARGRALLERHRQPVLAERYIDGREVNVTVLGNGSDLRCLPLHEIDFGKMPRGRPHIISYAAKWDESHEEYAGTLPVPMEAGAELSGAIERIAIDTFRALGLRDFGRVDVRIDRQNRPWVIDVNPNCDLSPGAGVAKAAAYAGMDYPRLIGRICELAWRRYVDPPAPSR